MEIEKPVLRTCSENSRRNRHSTSISECCLIFTSGELRESQHRYQHFISGRTAGPCPRDERPQTGCCLERPSFQSCLEPSPAGRVGSEGWETELPAALRPASPLGMNQGVRRVAGVRGVARAQAWLQELVPLVAGQFHPHLAKAMDLGSILGPFLRSQEASSQAPPPSSCQEMTGGLGMRAALPLPPGLGQLAGGGCYSPPKGPVHESGDLIPPVSSLHSRLGVGELGVRVPLAWSPSGSPAGQSGEGELDSAQLVSQTQLSCSCVEVLSFFPNVPQMLLALSHQHSLL